MSIEPRVAGGAILNESGGDVFEPFSVPATGEATKLQTPREINGVPFDGTANISVPFFTAPIRTINSNETVVLTDHTILVDAATGAITVTLPVANTATNKIVIVKKIDNSANAVTVDADGSETIDGAADTELTDQFDTVRLQCDGTAWFII